MEKLCFRDSRLYNYKTSMGFEMWFYQHYVVKSQWGRLHLKSALSYSKLNKFPQQQQLFLLILWNKSNYIHRSGKMILSNTKKVKGGLKKTCPFLSVCKMSDSITICSNEKTSRVFTNAECSIPSLWENKKKKWIIDIKQGQKNMD